MNRRLVLVLMLVLVLVLVASVTGCGYLEARGRDLSQIVRLEVGPALAFSVDTRLGGLLDFGVGGGYSWDAALLYGAPYAGKQLRIVAPGFCRRALGPTEEWSHTCPSILPPAFARETYTLPDYTHLGTHLHEYDVEAGVAAGVVHVHVGVSPGEILDFVLGLATIDIAGDDRGGKPAPHVPQRPVPAPPRGPAPAPRPAEPKAPPAPEPVKTTPDLAPPPSEPIAQPATPPPIEPLEPRAPPRRRR